MAKFTKTFENGIIENRLTFRGKDFTLTMVPTNFGSKSKEKTLETQVKNAFPDDSAIEEIAALADKLWCSGEDDIQEILEELEELE